MSTLLAALLLAAPSAAAGFEDCRIGKAGGMRLAAECLDFAVPENREAGNRRRLELAVARLKARGGENELAPVVFIAGGPGQSALESFPAIAGAFEPLRRDRDILLVDQRGTGGSNGLACPGLEQAEALPIEFDPAVARNAARDCVAALDADLRYYTTIDAVADLEALRKALGHEQLVLYGISYGTRVAQEYLRRHPGHVESVILDGVAVPGEALGPEIAADAQRALDLMFARCESSPACREAFPELGARFDRLRQRLERGPVEVELRDPHTGERTDTTISWQRVAMLLRLYSYAPETVSLMPLLLSQAEAGDWQAFAGNVVALERQSETLLFTGMHNSVVCAEDAPRFSPAVVDEPAYPGSLTVDAIEAICSVWPVRPVPADFHAPVKSDKPVLLLSGEADPVTPPENAEEVLAGFSNARHLVAPGQGHGIAWRGCAPQLLAEFVEARQPAELDAACLDELVASPFFIDRNGPTP